VIQEDMAVVLLLFPRSGNPGNWSFWPGSGTTGLSGPDEPVGANRRPGGMDGCRIAVEHSGVERDEVASIMDGCCVEYCIAARIL